MLWKYASAAEYLSYMVDFRGKPPGAPFTNIEEV